VNLDPSSDEFRTWADAAKDFVARYLESLRNRTLYPDTTSSEIRQNLDRALPLEPSPFHEVLRNFDDAIVAFSRQTGHPRMFGYVQSPGTPIGAIADFLASALNANLTAWRSAPAAVEIERLTVDWIKQLIGFDSDAAGLFVSGGSMANFAGLTAARAARMPPQSREHGIQRQEPPMCIYVSQETHHSVAKAADLLGIGRANVRSVEVDETSRIRIDNLETMIGRDLERGFRPMCVVANAGTVMTGAVDPLRAVSDVARKFDLWMHVDAAYGGFAVLAESVKPLFAGIERADSIALDPHKWLYLPVDCGCVLYRDPASARLAFASDAEYTRVIGHAADEAFAFWDYGPELTRRFRALKVWMQLKLVGVRQIAEAVEKDLACARHLQKLVQASNDFEMLAPVELSIFCFRYVPPHLRESLNAGDETRRASIQQELDRLNERLLVALQHDGSSYLSNALINGRFSLRGCVINYRTKLEDMEILLDDLRRVAKQIQ
jgi:aromatic-L-amino-acid/L-tryptophan decarboxylase